MKKSYMGCIGSFFILWMTFSQPAGSANFGFLYDTPAQYFTADDWKALEVAADKALNHLPNGKKLDWKNPRTGNHGSLMPLNTIKQHGTLCRDLQITNYARHRTDQYVFKFCQFKSGWKIPTATV